MNEKVLRNFVKETFGRNVSWVEPSFGSSFGKPDVDLNVFGTVFPIELKWCVRNKKGLNVKLRPAQMRYHIMSSREGMKTALMLGSCVLGKETLFNIWLLPGKYCKNPLLTQMTFVGSSDMKKSMLKAKIESVLMEKEFWK